MLEYLQTIYSSTFNPSQFDWNLFFDLRRTGELFSTKFENYSTTTSGIGTAMNDSVGLICEPSTETAKGRDDFANHNAFWWCYCNFTVDDQGVKIPTAIEGQSTFRRTGEVDVGILTPPLYWGREEVSGGYIWHLSDSEHPDGHPGLALELMPHCKDNKMKPMPYGIVPAYYAGEIGGKLYSSSGLACKNFIGYTQLHTAMTAKGTEYVGAGSERTAYLKIFLWIKYKTLNSQSIFLGCTSYSFQYNVAQAESSVSSVILTNAQAANVVVGNTVSLGNPTNAPSQIDRGQTNMRDIADMVKVTKVEDIGDGKSRVYVDAGKTFDTTAKTYISSMPLHSGQTDHILGSDGYVANDGKHSFRIQGAEDGIGAYMVSGNELMNKGDSGKSLTFYVRNGADYDAGSSAPTKWKNLGTITRTDTNDFWIGEESVDLATGASHPTTVGGGDNTGIGDRCYFGGANTGMREKLERGGLWDGAGAGFSCLGAWYGVSDAWWGFAVCVS